jgi:hypothetical protein
METIEALGKALLKFQVNLNFLAGNPALTKNILSWGL